LVDFQRIFDLRELLGRKSVLLLGPRMTGKSTLLRASLPEALFIDLLDASEFRALSSHPEHLADRVRAWRGPGVVVIDEIQKVPALLDEVHRLIERNKTVRFVLTGSSARKLRRSDTNLLAGRAARADLFPIVSAELPEGPSGYRTLLRWGGLPAVLTSSAPREELSDYVGTYLKEEIMAEGLSRNLGAFARFLETAAACNGEQIIFANVASDAGLPARTVRDHFQLVEDTLLGTLVPAFRRTVKRKAMAASKFYLFDLGVASSLLGRGEIAPRTPEYGRAFEQLLFSELRAYLSYRRIPGKIEYWRSLSNFEVDFIVSIQGGRTFAIEAKATLHVGERDLRGLRAFRQDVPRAVSYVVCEEAAARDTPEGIQIRSMTDFLTALWDDRLLS
jgi:uncharacterized protein